ncbi:CPBP family glutamic-type intramembrane protease [Pseudoneobacillus sp. C159]
MKNQKMLWLLLLILLSRTIFSLFAQGVFSWGSQFTSNPLDFLDAGKWWTVYGSLVDLGCLALMVWILRKEGTELKSIIGFSRARIKSDVIHSLLLLLVLLPLTVLWGNLISLLIYGQVSNPILAGPLPLWGGLYSVLIWPIGWAVMEQVIYMGYGLPKLVDIFRNKVTAVIIVMFFWALQHTVLPLTLDPNYSLYRFLTVIPMVIIPIYFLKTRRLVPLIFAHAIADCISALSFYFLPTG